YTSDTNLDMGIANCKIWVEDASGNRIAGDGPNHYNDCSSSKFGKNDHQILNFDNQTFWVHAKVQGSAKKAKVRGGFNANICLHIHGLTFDWGFDEVPC
ncbi:40798_t:CDS:1, partial [Gigaspora margarita]